MQGSWGNYHENRPIRVWENSEAVDHLYPNGFYPGNKYGSREFHGGERMNRRSDFWKNEKGYSLQRYERSRSAPREISTIDLRRTRIGNQNNANFNGPARGSRDGFRPYNRNFNRDESDFNQGRNRPPFRGRNNQRASSTFRNNRSRSNGPRWNRNQDKSLSQCPESPQMQNCDEGNSSDIFTPQEKSEPKRSNTPTIDLKKICPVEKSVDPQLYRGFGRSTNSLETASSSGKSDASFNSTISYKGSEKKGDAEKGNQEESRSNDIAGSSNDQDSIRAKRRITYSSCKESPPKIPKVIPPALPKDHNPVQPKEKRRVFLKSKTSEIVKKSQSEKPVVEVPISPVDSRMESNADSSVRHTVGPVNLNKPTLEYKEIDKTEYTLNTLPPFDGNIPVGGDRITAQVIHTCEYCNMSTFDDLIEKHMKTQYHYRKVKEYLSEKAVEINQPHSPSPINESETSNEDKVPSEPSLKSPSNESANITLNGQLSEPSNIELKDTPSDQIEKTRRKPPSIDYDLNEIEMDYEIDFM